MYTETIRCINTSIFENNSYLYEACVVKFMWKLCQKGVNLLHLYGHFKVLVCAVITMDYTEFSFL